MSEENPMREVKIEKVILSIGGIEEALDKGEKLLKMLTGKKPSRRKSKKRIPTLGVRPGLEVGVMVTLRGEKAEELLERLFATIDNQIKKKQISENTFSFGIKEYIEIPGVEYQRDVGIMGFDVTVSFSRAGKRVTLKKIKKGKLPKKQHISEEEIASFLENKFKIEVIGK